MKLYLSSYRIPAIEEFYELVGKREDISAALITNAKDYRDHEHKEVKIEALSEYLRTLGINVSTVNLRDYCDSSDVYQTLKDFDLVYAIGGNTFNLRQAMKLSGFDESISRLLSEGVVYAGESAGAIVMGSSLIGLETMDSLDEVNGEIVWAGLGFVEEVILPHADSPDYKDRVTPITQMYPNAIVLNDDQAYMVNNGSSKKVTGVYQ